MVREEVWKNAIKCFEECRSPFDTEELVKFDVTLDECYDLSQKISVAMEIYDSLGKKEKTAALKRLAVNFLDKEIPKIVNEIEGER